MNQTLRDLFDRRRLKIGAFQFERLYAILDGGGPVATLDDAGNLGKCGVVIVDEPPTPTQLSMLLHRLSPEATVVIPFSEDPAFDFIKSKLRGHGMIGACAPHAPHQIWWGALREPKSAGSVDMLRRAHVVSSVARRTHEDRDAIAFEQALANLGVSCNIRRSEPDIYCDDDPALRSRLLLEAWKETEQPLIWLDPSGGPDLSALSLNLNGADFAAIPTTDGGFSTNLLYFARSDATFDLLKSWNGLCRDFPKLPADHLLDAAWAMVCAQRNLVTTWLAPEGCKAVADALKAYPAYPFDHAVRMIAAPTPSRRQARKSSRTGSPEPTCVAKGYIHGRGPITMVTVSEQASAHDVALAIENAFDAFAANNGEFSLFGTIVCGNTAEAAQAIAAMGEGWIFYVAAGAVLNPDTFVTLAKHADEKRVLFMMPAPFSEAETGTGRTVKGMKCSALFGRPEYFNADHGFQDKPRPAPLNLVADNAVRKTL